MNIHFILRADQYKEIGLWKNYPLVPNIRDAVVLNEQVYHVHSIFWNVDKSVRLYVD